MQESHIHIFACRIISLAIAVIAMKNDVIGIRLLTKKMPIIPSTSVKMKSKSRSASCTEPLRYICNISSKSEHCQQCDTSKTFSANFIVPATFVPISSDIKYSNHVILQNQLDHQLLLQERSRLQLFQTIMS